ncbi:MAG: hypothetical protein HY898_21325 [Deltaproteobacteria bacterium]|nr:hypothetical protein [Deltaproteobacteria bacterium]
MEKSEKAELRAPQTEIARAQLPVCATDGDEELVDRVALEIRAILGRTVALGMEEVGELLLRTFYNDDPALYASTSHAKHVSLRLLERRCESLSLPVRRAFLGKALQLAVLSRTLPAQARFRLLPSSHRLELLPLRCPEKIEALAIKALGEKMSVKRVRSAVRKERGKHRSERGRKPTPAILKAIGSSARPLRDRATGRLAFRREDLAGLSREQLKKAQAEADGLLKKIEELIRLLQ